MCPTCEKKSRGTTELTAPSITKSRTPKLEVYLHIRAAPW